MNISERLKKARIDANFSQSELAEKLGIPVRTYRSYEHGERDLSTSVLVNICKVLNVSSDYLLGRKYFDEFSFEQKENAPLKIALEVLEKRLNALSDKELDELLLFIDFLKYKHNQFSD